MGADNKILHLFFVLEGREIMKNKLKKWENIEKKYKEILAGEVRCNAYILSHKEKEIKRLKEELEGLKEVGKIKDALIQVLCGGVFGKNISYEDVTNAINRPSGLEIKNTGDGYKIRTCKRKTE